MDGSRWMLSVSLSLFTTLRPTESRERGKSVQIAESL